MQAEADTNFDTNQCVWLSSHVTESRMFPTHRSPPVPTISRMVMLAVEITTGILGSDGADAQKKGAIVAVYGHKGQGDGQAGRLGHRLALPAQRDDSAAFGHEHVRAAPRGVGAEGGVALAGHARRLLPRPKN